MKKSTQKNLILIAIIVGFTMFFMSDSPLMRVNVDMIGVEEKSVTVTDFKSSASGWLAGDITAGVGFVEPLLYFGSETISGAQVGSNSTLFQYVLSSSVSKDCFIYLPLGTMVYSFEAIGGSYGMIWIESAGSTAQKKQQNQVLTNSTVKLGGITSLILQISIDYSVMALTLPAPSMSVYSVAQEQINDYEANFPIVLDAYGNTVSIQTLAATTLNRYYTVSYTFIDKNPTDGVFTVDYDDIDEDSTFYLVSSSPNFSGFDGEGDYDQDLLSSLSSSRVIVLIIATIVLIMLIQNNRKSRKRRSYRRKRRYRRKYYRPYRSSSRRYRRYY